MRKLYLRAGSSLVIVVDPKRRVVELHDYDGALTLDESNAIEHRVLPESSYAVRGLFSVLRRTPTSRNI